MSDYLPVEDHPLELNVSQYFSNGMMMTLRTAMGIDSPHNQWNWFRKEYPKLNPELYGVKNPLVEHIRENYAGLSRDELIQLCYEKEKELQVYHRMGL